MYEIEIILLLRDKLASYNSDSINSSLDFLLFDDVITHTLNIYRVIKRERVNILLKANKQLVRVDYDFRKYKPFGIIKKVVVFQSQTKSEVMLENL